MLGRSPLDFSHQPSTGNSHWAARLHKPCEVVQVQIIRPVVRKAIDAHDSVEELSGERQRPGVRMNRKHAVFDPGIPNTLHVLRGAEPEVRCPNLSAEFSPQEHRRRCSSAAEIQYAHAGPQVQRRGEPLAQPQRIGRTADAGENPFGMVLRRTRKSLADQWLVRSHVNSPLVRAPQLWSTALMVTTSAKSHNFPASARFVVCGLTDNSRTVGHPYLTGLGKSSSLLVSDHP